MVSMRRSLVLAALLSLAAPAIAWSPIEVSAIAGASMSMAAAPAAASQFGRGIVKADKRFGAGVAIIRDAQPLFAPEFSVDGHSLGSDHTPNFDLHGPPLAPRPPPLS
jgi:hypothetical protein